MSLWSDRIRFRLPFNVTASHFLRIEMRFAARETDNLASVESNNQLTTLRRDVHVNKTKSHSSGRSRPARRSRFSTSMSWR